MHGQKVNIFLPCFEWLCQPTFAMRYSLLMDSIGSSTITKKKKKQQNTHTLRIWVLF